jgi:polyhydroxyalkanoate synthase
MVVDGGHVTHSFFDTVVNRQIDWLAEQQRSWRRMLSVPRVVESARQLRVGATPCDVVYEEGTLRLLRYRRETPATYAEPVLFCYALINRHYIMDLQPEKSVVCRYLEQGFDVYMIDWGVPSDADRGMTLESYVTGSLKRVVDFILRQLHREDIHLLGYCMGGTISAMFAALHPEKVRSLTLMAAPIDFSGRESLLNLWMDRKYFDVDAFVDRHGNCPAVFLQTCFLLMKPVQNLVEKHLTFLDQLDNPRFVSSYFAMEHWVNDNIPVAGETFREFIKSFYQCNALVRGQFHLGARPVDLGRIACPLLVLTAENDHLVPPGSTEGILPHVTSRDVETMRIDAGHVGLVVGGMAHKSFWPRATRWLADRSSPQPRSTVDAPSL